MPPLAQPNVSEACASSQWRSTHKEEGSAGISVHFEAE